MECRLLECWNTCEFEKQYASDRLTRKDLLLESNDLWQLVVDHEKRCDYSVIHQHLGPVDENTRSAVPPVVREMVRYDLHLRALLAKKGGLDPALMDFLFGTPLAETLKRYGIQTKVDYEIITER
jgi:hypothetical protein